MAHLRVDRRDDPIWPRPAGQPRDPVLIDIEVLADQLPQQLVRREDRRVLKQPIGLLDGLQRALGILSHPAQHPLALALDTPPAVRLLARVLVVELQPVIQPTRGVLISTGDGISQLANAMTN